MVKQQAAGLQHFRFYGFSLNWHLKTNLINWYNGNISTYWSTEICLVLLYYTDNHQKQVVMRKSHDEPKPITRSFSTSWEWKY